MSEHLRAFVVIAVLSVMSFLVLHRPVVAMGMEDEDFRRRRNLWLAVTAVAFLSSNFWIFILIASGLLLLFARKERNPFALYLFLLFAVPPFAAPLPGLGIVNQLFELSFPRLLALLVLLPFVLRRRDPDTPGFGKHVADWLVVGYLLLQLVLQYRATRSPTPCARASMPSSTPSCLTTWRAGHCAAREAFATRCCRWWSRPWSWCRSRCSSSSSTGCSTPPWREALGVDFAAGRYLGRDGALRAVATAGHPIVLGYVMAIALLLHFGLRHANPLPRAWALGLAALGVGLVATVSRGPWVGAAVGILAIRWPAGQPGRRLVRLVLAGAGRDRWCWPCRPGARSWSTTCLSSAASTVAT